MQLQLFSSFAGVRRIVSPFCHYLQYCGARAAVAAPKDTEYNTVHEDVCCEKCGKTGHLSTSKAAA